MITPSYFCLLHHLCQGILMSTATNSSKTNSLIAGPSWYIDGSNFCFETRYKSNQDFGAPAAPSYPNVHGVNPRASTRQLNLYPNILFLETKSFSISGRFYWGRSLFGRNINILRDSKESVLSKSTFSAGLLSLLSARSSAWFFFNFYLCTSTSIC